MDCYKLILSGVALVLTACGNESSPLNIPPLPTEPATELSSKVSEAYWQVIDYQGHQYRSPFSLPQLLPTGNVASAVNLNTPCRPLFEAHQAAPLLQYPLSTLTLSGIVSSQDQQLALFELPNQSIYSARKHSYIGAEQYQITDITPNHIELRSSCGEVSSLVLTSNYALEKERHEP